MRQVNHEKQRPVAKALKYEINVCLKYIRLMKPLIKQEGKKMQEVIHVHEFILSEEN